VFTRARCWSPSRTRCIQCRTLPHYFPKIHSDIILPSTPRSSECSLPFRFSKKNAFLIFHMRATCTTRLILLDLITVIIFGDAYKLLLFCLSDEAGALKGFRVRNKVVEVMLFKYFALLCELMRRCVNLLKFSHCVGPHRVFIIPSHRKHAFRPQLRCQFTS